MRERERERERERKRERESSRGDFRDAICLRYGWKPPHMPSHCSYGEPFTVEHALSCSPRISCQTLVRTSRPSLTCNPSVESGFSQRQPSQPTKPGSTFKQEDFGVVDTRLRTSTSGCSTPMQARIAPNLSHEFTGSTRQKRKGSMESG